MIKNQDYVLQLKYEERIKLNKKLMHEHNFYKKLILNFILFAGTWVHGFQCHCSRMNK